MTPAKSNFVADVTMLNRIKIAPRQFRRKAWKRKWAWVIAQTHHIQYNTVKQGTQVLFTPFCSFLLLFTPFDSLLVPLGYRIPWTAENDTNNPVAMLPLQAAGTGSIMEPQARPAEKNWLHGGATNEARNGAKSSLAKLDWVCGKTGIETGIILVPILKTGLDLIPILVSFWSQV